MKAAFRLGTEMFLKDVESPSPDIGQIRVGVTACGACGTDLHLDPTKTEIETRMTGHEVADVIEEIGPGVHEVEVGQSIVLDSATPCARCDRYRNAQQELCSNIQSFFLLNSFGFAEGPVAQELNNRRESQNDRQRTYTEDAPF